MKPLAIVFAIAVLSGRETRAAQSELTYSYIQTGYTDGATVSGSFTGADLDGNGVLVHFMAPDGQGDPPFSALELTAFAMHFSGNSLAPAFDLTLDDLYGFVFEIDTDGIGDDPAFDPNIGGDITEGIGAIGGAHFYTSGLGPNGMIGGYVGGQIDLNNLPDFAEHALDSSASLVLVTRVPEPSTALMVVTLFLLMMRRSLQCATVRGGPNGAD
jgi:hypothetical protein